MSDKFNPRDHIIDMRGKDYLEVKWRLVWFKTEHPTGGIETDLVSVDPLILKASVYDGDGKKLATGHGTANEQPNQKAVWNGRAVEKAETAAIGRALAHAGYGTQFTDEDEDAPADSPVDHNSRNDKPATPKGKPANVSQLDNGAAWDTSEKNLTQLIAALAPVCVAQQERYNTVHKMVGEHAFDTVSTLQGAIQLATARLQSPEHGKAKKAADLPKAANE